MSEFEDPTQLVAATQTLAERVHELGEKIAISEASQREIQSQARQQAINVTNIEVAAKRQRVWIRVQAVCGVLLLGGGIWLWNVAAAANDAATAAKDAVTAVKTNAVTNCENTNEARKGTLRLWLGIIDAPRPDGSPARTKEQEQQIADLRQFVEQLFRPRDCKHLDRPYPLPDLPDSLKPRK